MMSHVSTDITLYGDYDAMGIERDNEIVAGILLEGYNGHNINAHIAYDKFSKSFIELIDNAIIYTFGQLKVKRVTGYVNSDNEKALKLDMHIGFNIEGIMKQSGPQGQDIYILVLWPENCWRLNHGK